MPASPRAGGGYHSYKHQQDLMNLAAQANVSFNSSAINFGSTLNNKQDDRLDVWKLIIKDDANRFQIENQEKVIRKKLT